MFSLYLFDMVRRYPSLKKQSVNIPIKFVLRERLKVQDLKYKMRKKIRISDIKVRRECLRYTDFRLVTLHSPLIHVMKVRAGYF